MADQTADEILKRFETLRNARSVHEKRWQDLAELMRPLRAEFSRTRPQKGDTRTTRMYDATPAFAGENFAAGVYGMMTSPANKWFGLRTADDDLMEYQPVAEWLDDATNRVLLSFGPSTSRFYNVIPSLYADIAIFGTGVFYSDEIVGSGKVFDTTRPLAECYVAANQHEEIDTVYRGFTFEARQAVQRFRDSVSPATISLADKAPFAPVDFVHCVQPNEDYREGALGPRGAAYVSVYIEKGPRTVAERGVYREIPYMVPRWSVAAGEVYGRGPGDLAHPDVRMLTAMMRSTIIAAQRAADPPLLAPDEGVISVIRNYPGSVIYGGRSMQGNDRLGYLESRARVDISLEMINQVREQVRNAFYWSQLQLVGRPNMTATEYLGLQEEKLRLMSPNLGMLQSEFLSPLIKRRAALLYRAGALPPLPEELQGQTLDIEYVSPLAKMQKVTEANSVVRFFNTVQGFATLDPDAGDNFDADEGASVVADAFGVPPKVKRSRDEVEQRRQERAEKQQAAEALAAGEQGSNILKNVGAAVRPGGGQAPGQGQAA